jgi:hypothetical protein
MAKVDYQEIRVYEARASVDWTVQLPFNRGKQRTTLEKTISNTNSRELTLIHQAKKEEDVPEVRMSKIFHLKNKKWVHAGYQCLECNKVFNDEEVRENHRYVCKRTSTRMKEMDE